VSANGRYRELTFASIAGGIVVGAILNMGIVFAGMQIGFTIVGSTVGAILGFGVLRGILRHRSILEINIFQTVASSVNTVNAGVIFTVPVLFLLGMQEDIDYTALLLATMAGSLLGVVMIIPLRKQVIDFERLRFPTAVGVAAILKSPGAGVEKARLLLIGVLVSMAVKFLTLDWNAFPNYWPESFDVGALLTIPAGLHLVFAVSFLTLGAGYLAGRAGLAVLYGVLLNFWVLAPLCAWLGWIPDGNPAAAAQAEALDLWGRTSDAYANFSAFLGSFRGLTSRHVGIGMILGGAVAGILVAAPALKAALASLRSVSLSGRQEEVSMNVLNASAVAGLALLFGSVKLAGGDHVSWGTAFLVTLAGGAWLWVAGLVVAQTTGRTDWSPLSGLALIAIAIMMGIMGIGNEYVVPAVTVGAAICVATSMCADMMADFKTGYLVGGMPLKQQIAQIATCWIGPGIALATVIILWEAYSFGPEQAATLYERKVAAGGEVLQQYVDAGGSETRLASGVPLLEAPQAGALEAAINIVQANDVPVLKYGTGAVIGLLISLFVAPGLGVMVGLSMYLPFAYMILFGLGGIINMTVTRLKGARFAEDKGVPIAAGLIVGDALVGVANAVLKVATSV
jgi:putative OPT family oligopeptide transporter